MSDSKNNTIHILPLSLYLSIGSILLVLTAITVWVGVSFDFGPINLIVAMLIAATKATLVALYFMHLKYDSKVYLSLFIGGILFLAIFIVFTMLDTMRRQDIYEIKGTPLNNMAEMYQGLSTVDSISDSTDVSTDVSTIFTDTIQTDTTQQSSDIKID